VIYSLSAYPFGKLSDSVHRSKPLAWGISVMIGADVALAYGNQGGWCGVALHRGAYTWA
jgi:hypothetical protein